MKNLLKWTFMVLALMGLTGCDGVRRLIDGKLPDPGTPITVPTSGNLANPNAVPLYDQSTATVQQDEELVRRLIGDPATRNFQEYAASAWIPRRLNGMSDLITNPPIGYSSMLVDSWKALARLGYVDMSKVNDPNSIRSNTYPVPVYQDDPVRWGY